MKIEKLEISIKSMALSVEIKKAKLLKQYAGSKVDLNLPGVPKNVCNADLKFPS